MSSAFLKYYHQLFQQKYWFFSKALNHSFTYSQRISFSSYESYFQFLSASRKSPSPHKYITINVKFEKQKLFNCVVQFIKNHVLTITKYNYLHQVPDLCMFYSPWYGSKRNAAPNAATARIEIAATAITAPLCSSCVCISTNA